MESVDKTSNMEKSNSVLTPESAPDFKDTIPKHGLIKLNEGEVPILIKSDHGSIVIESTQETIGIFSLMIIKKTFIDEQISKGNTSILSGIKPGQMLGRSVFIKYVNNKPNTIGIPNVLKDKDYELWCFKKTGSINMKITLINGVQYAPFTPILETSKSDTMCMEVIPVYDIINKVWHIDPNLLNTDILRKVIENILTIKLN